MKKILLFGLSLVAVLFLSACNSNGGTNDPVKFYSDGNYIVGEDIDEGVYYVSVTQKKLEDTDDEYSSITMYIWKNETSLKDYDYEDTKTYYLEEGTKRVRLKKNEVIAIDSSNIENFTITFFTEKQYEDYINNSSSSTSSTKSEKADNSGNEEGSLDGTWYSINSSDDDQVVLDIDGSDFVMTVSGASTSGTIDTSDKTVTLDEDDSDEKVTYKMIGEKLVLTLSDGRGITFSKVDSQDDNWF